MPNCVIKTCKNYDAKFTKKDGISYHRFPNDPVRNEKWCRIIRQHRKDPYFKPHKNTRVCSAHFCDSDIDVSKAGLRRLKETAVPQLEIEVCKNEELRPSTPAQSSQAEEMIVEVDISDLDPIFDSPKEVQLKRRIEKLENRLRMTVKKIKTLQNQNGRLKKKNKLMLDIFNELKSNDHLPEQIESVFEEKTEIA